MIVQKLTRLDQMVDLLGPADQLEHLDGHQVPEPYRTLLVHHGHMTVALERYWRSPTDLHVIDYWDHHPTYTRRIALTASLTGKQVEFGLVQIDFTTCSEEVQAEIRARREPLGRILLRHGVLTEINCHGYLRMEPSRIMLEAFGIKDKGPMYGRFAEVDFNGHPAMMLLEVMPAGLEVHS